MTHDHRQIHAKSAPISTAILGIAGKLGGVTARRVFDDGICETMDGACAAIRYLVGRGALRKSSYRVPIRVNMRDGTTSTRCSNVFVLSPRGSMVGAGDKRGDAMLIAIGRDVVSQKTTLADEFGISLSSVRCCIDRLNSAGLITAEKGRAAHSYAPVWHYRLTDLGRQRVMACV